LSKANNVFISWSGEQSRVAAQALKDWLPMVINAVEPWMSDADIDKGSRGLSEISNALGVIKFGIVCLTPDNQDSRWLNYEAGSLSKTIDGKTRLWTYLLAGLTPERVIGPLGMFQHTRADKEDTRKLVHSINQAVSAEPIPEARLDSVFEGLWPNLEKRLLAIPAAGNSAKKRPTDEMVAELLDLVRSDVSRRREDLEQMAAKWQARAAELERESAMLSRDLSILTARRKLEERLGGNDIEGNGPIGVLKSKRTYMVRTKDGTRQIVKAHDVREVGPGHYSFKGASGEIAEEIKEVQEMLDITEKRAPLLR
jgi:hypothetical protein